MLFDTNHPDRGIQIVDIPSGSVPTLRVTRQQRRNPVGHIALCFGRGFRACPKRRTVGKKSQLDGSRHRHRIRSAVDASASVVVA